MRKPSSKYSILLVIVTGAVLLSSCHKQVASKPPASAPAKPQSPTATVQSVTPAAPSQKEQASTPAPTIDELFQQKVKDAFFNYDKADIRSDATTALVADADFFRAHPEVRFAIEGHCDERGSEEYNLGLGDRRATAVKRYLVNLGIADSRIQTTSYGKERPFCTGHDESCWGQNRRGHVAMVQ